MGNRSGSNRVVANKCVRRFLDSGDPTWTSARLICNRPGTLVRPSGVQRVFGREV